MALTKTKPKVVVRKEWLPKKGFAKSLSCASTTIVRNVELKCPKMEIVAAFKVTPEAMPCTLPVVTWADHRGKVQKLSSAGVLAQRNPVKWAIIKTRMIGKFGKLISSQKRS